MITLTYKNELHIVTLNKIKIKSYLILTMKNDKDFKNIVEFKKNLLLIIDEKY